MSNHPLIQFATQPQLKTARGDHEFKVGDGVKVSTKVREGDKERTQVFSGIVIQRKGGGIHETFTVRRVSFGEGVERTFPVHSPNIEKIEVERVSQVMRARLFYLRERQGKSATKVREGDKERTQTFAGIVIQRKGGGIHETFTVRRVSFGEGVERTFPVHSPNIEKIEVERVSQVMRARLFYLRDRQGKSATKVKEKRFDPTEHAAQQAAAAAAAAAAK